MSTISGLANSAAEAVERGTECAEALVGIVRTAVLADHNIDRRISGALHAGMDIFRAAHAAQETRARVDQLASSSDAHSDIERAIAGAFEIGGVLDLARAAAGALGFEMPPGPNLMAGTLGSLGAPASGASKRSAYGRVSSETRASEETRPWAAAASIAADPMSAQLPTGAPGQTKF